MTPSDSSVILVIEALRQGDSQAAKEIWDRYAPRLQVMAKKWVRRVGNTGEYDEEDVAVSALGDFFQGVADGRFPDLKGGTDIWQLLAVIAARKANNMRKKAQADKRGGQNKAQTTDAMEQVAGTDLPPDLSAMMMEECRLLLDQLKDRDLESVALLKLDGFTNDEVAAKLGFSRRTIQRMLKLIREIWETRSS